MDLITGQEAVPDHLVGGVAALGNFDGVHRGHQRVVGEARRLARTLEAPLLVVTFDPHAARFFKPDLPPFQLTSFAERARLWEAFGVDALVAIPFNADLAALSPEAFFQSVLCDRLRIRGVVAGYDYTFGKGRAGTPETLKALGIARDVAVSIVDPVIAGADAAISSTLIRRKLTDGAPFEAAELLGHWWVIEGTVTAGDQRGRTIGFPTANLDLGDYQRPRFGVYATRAVLADGRVVDGIANIGLRPTFQPPRELLELHLFDFAGDLYGQNIRVELVEFIRPERKFPGLDALKAQISADCATALKILRQPHYARGRFPSAR